MMISNNTIRSVLDYGSTQISRSESEWLLQEVLAIEQKEKILSHSSIYLNEDKVVPLHLYEIFKNWISRRVQGEPLQYIIGHQYFLDHIYSVGPGVLVPRTETEMFCQIVIDILKKGNRLPSKGIEIGLGSGILSIELLFQFEKLVMYSSDVSDQAILYATKNAKKILGDYFFKQLNVIKSTHTLQVFEPFDSHTSVDFIISNPPYLTLNDEIASDVFLNEPFQALFAPQNDPLYFYRKIAEKSEFFLTSKGWVFLEIPHERALEIKKLFPIQLFDIEILNDLTGRERILIGRLKK